MKPGFSDAASFSLIIVTFGAQAAPKAGRILHSKGQVLFLNKNAKVVADPEGKRGRKTGTDGIFYEGETVQTGPDGRVKLRFAQGGNIERASPSNNKAGTSLSLARGEIRLQLNRKYSGEGEDKFEVKTRNAVAGVRGTTFLAKYDPKSNASQFATEKGVIAVASRVDTNLPSAGPPQGPVEVPAGMFTSSVGATASIEPRPLASNPQLQEAVQTLAGLERASTDSAQSTNSAPGQAQTQPQSSGAKSEAPPTESKPAPTSAAASEGGDKKSGSEPVPLGREPVARESSAGGDSRALTSQGAAPALARIMGEETRPRAVPASMPNLSNVQRNTTEVINNVNRTRQTETLRPSVGEVVVPIE